MEIEDHTDEAQANAVVVNEGIWTRESNAKKSIKEYFGKVEVKGGDGRRIQVSYMAHYLLS